MSAIRPTTDLRTPWLLVACILAPCLAVPAPGVFWQDRAVGEIAGGIRICTPEILIPKPPPPVQATTDETA